MDFLSFSKKWPPERRWRIENLFGKWCCVSLGSKVGDLGKWPSAPLMPNKKKRKCPFQKFRYWSPTGLGPRWRQAENNSNAHAELLRLSLCPSLVIRDQLDGLRCEVSSCSSSIFFEPAFSKQKRKGWAKIWTVLPSESDVKYLTSALNRLTWHWSAERFPKPNMS